MHDTTTARRKEKGKNAEDAGIPESSHVLTTMGYSLEDARSCIRFSIGRFTTEQEVEEALVLIKTVLL